MIDPPPIDLCTAQYLRCYVERRRRAPPVSMAKAQAPATAVSASQIAPEVEEIQRIGFPYEGYCLVLDTETTTDERQALRFGCYTIRGISEDDRIELCRRGHLTRERLDAHVETGYFYAPETLDPAEVETLQAYCRKHHHPLYTVREFVQVFYKWVYWDRALCIGHNLPFDLSRLATSWGPGIKQFKGGFWMSLCGCEHGRNCFYHPPIRIKTLGPKKARIKFAANRPPKGKAKRYPGRFLDTATFGLALLGPGDASLAAMGQRFQASTIKREWGDEHGATLTAAYLDYARQDVTATWDLYVAERALFARHAVSTPPWKIYSEASLGKAYLRDMGVPRFTVQHSDFPKAVLGHFMQTYYGGRSEVRIRLQPTEVILTDFKSQYPTVNALMQLQSLLLAERLEVRPAKDAALEFLKSLTLDTLRDPRTWRRLRCIVQVIPAGDILPVRTRFKEKDATLNIGVNHLTSPIPTWYTLADVAASVLLTGRTPEVVDAVELVPHGMCATAPKCLFGDPRYRIDLSLDDLFARVIDLRSEVKQRQRSCSPGTAEREHLEGMQLGLKLLANSTAYGALVEVNKESDSHQKVALDVFATSHHRTGSHFYETPGIYFSGPIGTLIPAAGRLLLAIAERLAADRGIGYAFCDTDSMAFARPEGMNRTAFLAHVEAITAWFEPLSPYSEPGSILQCEAVNDWEGRPEPLYCLAVSAKRYALYNRMQDGTYRLRKFSSHGTGDLIAHPGAGSWCTPAPCENVYRLGGPRWKYDFWYEATRLAEGGEDKIYVAGPHLDAPVLTRVSVSTWRLLQNFKEVPGLRPFSFVTVLPALNRPEIMLRQMTRRAEAATGQALPQKVLCELEGVPYVAPYGRTFADLAGRIRELRGGSLVAVDHKTLNERLSGYFSHPEPKSWPMEGVGPLRRRNVLITEHVAIGKESNAVLDDVVSQSGGALSPDADHEYAAEGLCELVRSIGPARLARLTGIPRQSLYDIARGAKPRVGHRTVIAEAIAEFIRQEGESNLP